MLSEWELWAVAHETLRLHGEQAPAFVAERIEALMLAGDAAGVATWGAIATRMARLSDQPRGAPH